MNILHIAAIDNGRTNGVCVVVPQHINAQNVFASTALLNVNGKKINSVHKQLAYEEENTIASLEPPFNRPDLVVFHECYVFKFLKIARELKDSGIPYIIVPHGELHREAQRKKWLKKKVANLVLFNRFIGNSAGLHFLTNAEAKNSITRRPFFVCPNGVSAAKRRKAFEGSNVTTFVYIGRYEMRQKGIDLMLNAAYKEKDFLISRGCKINLYGPDYRGRKKKILRLMEKLGLKELVTVNDAVCGEEKYKVLASADFFIQTSRYEGLPAGILEALEYGVPCILTKGTSIAEEVSNAGAGLYAGEDINHISKAMVYAVEHKDELRAASARATSFVDERYGWRKVADRTIEEYGRIVKNVY